MPASDTPWFLFILLAVWVALTVATLEPSATPGVPRFVQTDDGSLADTNTALVWRPGPDRSMSWAAAKDWVAAMAKTDYRWRMPTIEEVRSLSHDGVGSTLLADAFQSTGYWAWAADESGSPARWLFSFSYGGEGWNGAPPPDGGRAFAVRVPSR